jgi:hypothetical protein
LFAGSLHGRRHNSFANSTTLIESGAAMRFLRFRNYRRIIGKINQTEKANAGILSRRSHQRIPTGFLIPTPAGADAEFLRHEHWETKGDQFSQ